jgi:hypothetical protein
MLLTNESVTESRLSVLTPTQLGLNSWKYKWPLLPHQRPARTPSTRSSFKNVKLDCLHSASASSNNLPALQDLKAHPVPQDRMEILAVAVNQETPAHPVNNHNLAHRPSLLASAAPQARPVSPDNKDPRAPPVRTGNPVPPAKVPLKPRQAHPVLRDSPANLANPANKDLQDNLDSLDAVLVIFPAHLDPEVLPVLRDSPESPEILDSPEAKAHQVLKDSQDSMVAPEPPEILVSPVNPEVLVTMQLTALAHLALAKLLPKK